MANLTRWLIQVEGAPVHLETLARSFPTGDILVVEETGRFFLTGPGLNSLNEPEPLRAAAEVSLRELSGAIGILQPEFRMPTIRGFTREHPDGRKDQYVFMQGIASIAQVGTPTVVTDPASGPDCTPAQALLTAAQKSVSLREALRLWCELPRSWPRLYVVLETVERHLGQTVNEASFCSKTERGRFTRTANTAAAGIDSRHAAGQFRPPRNPMLLEDAVLFIRNVLHAALR